MGFSLGTAAAGLPGTTASPRPSQQAIAIDCGFARNRQRATEALDALFDDAPRPRRAVRPPTTVPLAHLPAVPAPMRPWEVLHDRWLGEQARQPGPTIAALERLPWHYPGSAALACLTGASLGALRHGLTLPWYGAAATPPPLPAAGGDFLQHAQDLALDIWASNCTAGCDAAAKALSAGDLCAAGNSRLLGGEVQHRVAVSAVMRDWCGWWQQVAVWVGQASLLGLYVAGPLAGASGGLLPLLAGGLLVEVAARLLRACWEPHLQARLLRAQNAFGALAAEVPAACYQGNPTALLRAEARRRDRANAVQRARTLLLLANMADAAGRLGGLFLATYALPQLAGGGGVARGLLTLQQGLFCQSAKQLVLRLCSLNNRGAILRRQLADLRATFAGHDDLRPLAQQVALADIAAYDVDGNGEAPLPLPTLRQELARGKKRGRVVLRGRSGANALLLARLFKMTEGAQATYLDGDVTADVDGHLPGSPETDLGVEAYLSGALGDDAAARRSRLVVLGKGFEGLAGPDADARQTCEAAAREVAEQRCVLSVEET